MNEFPGPGRPSDSDGDDESVRRMLSDAVSDVEPRGSLDSIRSRTTTPMRSRRPWLLGAAAAAVATAAVVTGVAVTGNLGGTSDQPDPGFAASPSVTAGREPSASAQSGEPSQNTNPSPNAAPAVVEMTVPVYFAAETTRGTRLYREFRTTEGPEGDEARVAARLALGDAADPDYRSDWPDGTGVSSVDYDGDVITVDLTAGPDGLRDRPAGMSQEQAAMAIEQMIYTVQAAVQQGRPGVQLLVDGEHSDTVLGQPASEPLSQGDPTEVLAQVWIIEPTQEQELTAPFTVSGLGAAFEANLVWELRQGDRVVKQGFTTAEVCCEMAPYSFEVNVPPGDYTLVVEDTDPSGGEGFGPWRDTKQITVLP
jgi:hypothetical protein